MSLSDEITFRGFLENGGHQRIPQATYLSFRQFVGSLRRSDLQQPVVRPIGMRPQTWAQLHASLSSLELIQHEMATIALQRLIVRECSTLQILESQFGSDVIVAIEGGESCMVGSLKNLAEQKTERSIYRFESFVRGALKEQGRLPARRFQYSAKKQTRGGTAILTNNLLESEANLLLESLSDRLAANDLESAGQIRVMLGQVRNELRNNA
jgi:hypothetical protein